MSEEIDIPTLAMQGVYAKLKAAFDADQLSAPVTTVPLSQYPFITFGLGVGKKAGKLDCSVWTSQDGDAEAFAICHEIRKVLDGRQIMSQDRVAVAANWEQTGVYDYDPQNGALLRRGVIEFNLLVSGA